MFGLFRTFLALTVLGGHAFGPHHAAVFAVFSFFVLSGFLMTAVMHQTYGYNATGRIRFLINRFLRIYPAYWASIALSILILLILGANLEKHSFFQLPNNLVEWLRNVLLVISFMYQPKLSPLAWAITTELVYYLLICLGLSRTKRWTLLWFALGVGYTLYLIILEPTVWTMRYFNIAASALPFSIGALLFHYQAPLKLWLARLHLRHPLFWMGAATINFLVFYNFRSESELLLWLVGFYLNLPLIALLIVSLLNPPRPYLSGKLDAEIGKYSYPIYLLHFQVMFVVEYLTSPYLGPWFMTREGVVYTAICTLITVLLSFLLIKCVDEPIEKIRKRFKRSPAIAKPAAE